MKVVYELELWSRPGQNLPAEFGSELEARVDSELAIGEGVCFGLSFVPSATDTTNLLHCINERELRPEEFERFCRVKAFVPSISNHESSARFLEHTYGRALAWLHIPHNNEGLSMLNKISQWASANGFNVQCGQNLFCLVGSGSEVPPNW